MLIPKEEVEEEDFSQYYAKKTWLDNDFLFMIDANYFQAFQNEEKFKYNERLTEISDKIEKCYMRLPQAMKEKAKDIMSLIEQDKKNYKEKLDCYFNNGQYYTNILDKFDSLINDLTTGLPAEIAARQKQYEYYRDKLLTFKELS